ncbi:MAG: PSD1 and planctomycete cytochrome C domain-containing protein [Planctomycetaceae bacterium]
MFFTNDVLPVLKANCLKCHSGSEPKAGLRLTSRADILQGGESGPAVDLEDHAGSYLISAVNYDGWEMPPTGQMSPKQIAVITRWVEGGLAWPADLHEIEVEAEKGPPPVNEQNKQFWSFQPVHQPQVPAVAQAEWPKNDIDAFILHRLESKGLQPSPPADPRALIRRTHYDLLGLPPSTELVERFAADPSPEAYSTIIDELLDSPHYGEQWGRHWLDLVRYAETNSYERDDAKPFVWRYRDYVIQSFNGDKPYDRFVTEQIAGDELDDVTADSMVATGYYRLGRWDDEPVDPELAFYDDIDDIVTTTGQTFLGLTVNCGRCHDHKIDPITQADYYGMVAFFRNVRRFGVRGHDTVLDASVTEIDRPENRDLHAQAIERYENEVNDARRHLKEIEDIIRDDLNGVEKDEFQYAMNRVPIVEKRQGSLLNEEQVNRYRHQTNRLRKLERDKPTGLAQALVVKEDIRDLPTTHILTRGSPHAPADEVVPAFPAILSPPEAVVPTELPENATTSGRRRVLAEWLVSPSNPLTARVMVNRLWQYHFGRGIVRSSSDFGFQGTPPTHPELLDWLAAKFIQEDWSMKQMHRLIMTSATYQQSSRPRADAYAADPANDLFWRYDMRRLSAEEIRDSILAVTGSLTADRMYGPSIYTDIPDAVKAGQSRPGYGWGKSSPEDENRRSVYIHVKRSLLDPLLEAFDMADTDQTCPVRFVTTQPTQALGMLNSEFINKQAAQFSQFLQDRAGDSIEAQVKLALERVTQRPPTDKDVQRGLDLIESLKSEHNMTESDARHYFCLAALNLNEFLYLD